MSETRTRIPLLAADAVLFDLDGVLTDTAAVHRRAWADLFGPYLETHRAAPFTDDDYYRLIDGRPRAAGVENVLSSRGLDLPPGSPDDPPSADTAAGLGNRKNAAFAEILRADGVRVFDGSLRVVQALRRAHVPTGVVSSSRNARAVLERAGLLTDFDVIVDGEVAARDRLPGKPHPAMFLTAADALGADATRTIGVEDAVSGVAAAHRGGLWVVGVDRGAGYEELVRAGADQVVRDVAELLS
ncbi:beta-phosphoglucomutase family hydrolase [Tsukamurella sp. 8F]|uniref:HAD family hydrolase n=1 Tax=unclassified Tsukamurella TaxID=2633480 RepID=UPI0023B8DEA4|nr:MULTISPECIES: beta-phosphoglucomutase family hydrolase [unclassified Tsukamurella]MDF0530425.1 beta-phosphoglucomutase family hydrolase [Tsukamurella sp. 8J]MDF0587754.1 beta-phosphoglucomutase family hydrolase [Tsukamurella sp. 8F]